MSGESEGLPEGLSYEPVRLDAFPGAEMLALRVRDEGLVGLGAHAGLADGAERIRAAHRYFTRARAAVAVAESPEGQAVLESVEARGGTPFARTLAYDREAAADMPKARARALAMALVLDDTYRATRRIEEESFAEGSDALLRLVGAARDKVDALARLPETMLAGARRLEASAPGPHTLLSRMLATLRGEPDEDPARIARRAGEGDELEAVLGCVLVRPKGPMCKRPANGGPVELTVVATFWPDQIEFDEAGGIEGLHCRLRLLHDPATWDASADGRLYRDRGTEAAVDALLRSHGVDAGPGWSEMGMQTPEAGDMDVGDALAEALWGDIIAERRQVVLDGRAGPR